MSEVKVEVLRLQRLVTKEEIMRMRLLRKEGLSIPKIARIMKRSPTTVSHYLKTDHRMGNNIPIE